MPSCLVADLRHEHIAIVKEEKVGPPYCANPHSKHYPNTASIHDLATTPECNHRGARLPASTP